MLLARKDQEKVKSHCMALCQSLSLLDALNNIKELQITLTNLDMRLRSLHSRFAFSWTESLLVSIWSYLGIRERFASGVHVSKCWNRSLHSPLATKLLPPLQPISLVRNNSLCCLSVLDHIVFIESSHLFPESKDGSLQLSCVPRRNVEILLISNHFALTRAKDCCQIVPLWNLQQVVATVPLAVTQRLNTVAFTDRYLYTVEYKDASLQIYRFDHFIPRDSMESVVCIENEDVEILNMEILTVPDPGLSDRVYVFTLTKHHQIRILCCRAESNEYSVELLDIDTSSFLKTDIQCHVHREHFLENILFQVQVGNSLYMWYKGCLYPERRTIPFPLCEKVSVSTCGKYFLCLFPKYAGKINFSLYGFYLKSDRFFIVK